MKPFKRKGRSSKGWSLIASPLFFPRFASDFPWLSHIQMPSRGDFLRHQALTSLPEMLEAHAQWKEFSYASALALVNLGTMGPKADSFYDFTEALNRAHLANLRYRTVADLIFASTGCGLATLAPGYILDIALSPPMTGESVEWTQFHPCARLAEILRVWGDLKLPDWVGRPNYDPAPTDAYEELDTLIAKKLGWHTSLENLRGLVDALADRLPKEASQEKEFDRAAAMRAVWETRFIFCMGQKLKQGRFFIHPVGERKDLELAWSASMPMATVWNDTLWMTELVMPNALLRSFFIRDMVVNLFLDDFLNTSPAAPLNFRLARNFHNRASAWLEANPGHINLIEPTFDAFASNVVGYPWQWQKRSVAGR
jgi:hypothetical protein